MAPPRPRLFFSSDNSSQRTRYPPLLSAHPNVSSSRGLGVLRTPGLGSKEPPVAATRPSSRTRRVLRTPGPGGKKPPVAATRPSSRGLGVLTTPVLSVRAVWTRGRRVGVHLVVRSAPRAVGEVRPSPREGCRRPF